MVPSSNPTGGALGCDLGCYSKPVVVIKLWGTSAFTGLDNPLASGSHLQKSQAILGPLQPGLAWPGGYGRSSMTEERATGCSSGQGGFFVPDLETGPEAVEEGHTTVLGLLCTSSLLLLPLHRGCG